MSQTVRRYVLYAIFGWLLWNGIFILLTLRWLWGDWPTPSVVSRNWGGLIVGQQLKEIGIFYFGATSIGVGLFTFLLGRRLLMPIRLLNQQLEQIDPSHLDRKIELDEAESEIISLREHINDLLARTNLTLIQQKQYAAQVAHELRGPLTLIRLKIEQAADKIDPALGEEIQRELLRLNLHVEQALFVAKVEQGHLSLNRSTFDLGNLLEDVVEDFRLLALDERRTICCKTQPVLVSADPKYVRQILYSLLTNSLRHGQGDIRIQLQASRRLLISNYSKPPPVDDMDLGLGKRIVGALVGLHGNMRLHSRRLGRTYGVCLGFLT